MKFDQKRAVSPIIASLLLIAIAVAAGIIVYVYVNSLAGNLTGSGGAQESQQIQLQAYSYTASGASSSGTGKIIDVYLTNVGSSSITIGNIYVDGNQLTEWGNTGGVYDTTLMVPNTVGNCFAAVTTAVTFIVGISGTQANSGGAATCTGTAASAACTTTNPCLTTTPTTPAETLTLAAQAQGQILIGLFTSQTSGTSHTIKIVTTTGGQEVFTVVAGRTG
jgi:flagellin-like protein